MGFIEGIPIYSLPGNPVAAVITFLIAGLVLWQGLKMLPKTIHLLMEVITYLLIHIHGMVRHLPQITG